MQARDDYGAFGQIVGISVVGSECGLGCIALLFSIQPLSESA
jgi:hypothetical protein